MKDLPIGLQTFSKIIEGGYVYADKTKYVYDLARREGAYFLSRPRRFGKSLLLSTFEALFSGPPDPSGSSQGLFADLWIARESDYDFKQTHPILTFSMSSDTASTVDLRESILKKLEEINQSEQLGLNISLPGTDLFLLIKRLKEKYGKGVVVLIDEYDAPVSNNID
ncbi:MAG: AAA family ATPase, partial [Deltaproteobacteria bacterium]|nr:AAA family ATPase [Deltaproteobacteria bacterium]